MKPLVYYIDDSKEALELVEMVTKFDDRFDLVTVLTEKELYEKLADRDPNALILDLNLGENLTGSVLSIKLRKDYPTIPIAIYTSYEKTRVEKLIPEKDLESKSTSVWQKSEIDIDELSDKIAMLVRNKDE